MLNTLIYNLQNMEHLKKKISVKSLCLTTHTEKLYTISAYFFFTCSGDSRALEQFLPRSRHSCYE